MGNIVGKRGQRTGTRGRGGHVARENDAYIFHLTLYHISLLPTLGPDRPFTLLITYDATTAPRHRVNPCPRPSAFHHLRSHHRPHCPKETLLGRSNHRKT